MINNTIMRSFFIYLFVALLGGFGYCFIEILWRGRTHYSMFFAGAIILASFYYISASFKLPLWAKAIIGMVIITAVEFIFGIVFNILLKENVWDYSNMPFNLLGQICVTFSLIWLGVSAAVFAVIDKAEPLLR